MRTRFQTAPTITVGPMSIAQAAIRARIVTLYEQLAAQQRNTPAYTDLVAAIRSESDTFRAADTDPGEG